MVVADASALIDALIRRGLRGDWAAATLAGNVAIAAPHLVNPEFLSALTRLVRRGAISTDDAVSALSSFSSLRIRRFPVTGLLTRLWDLREVLSPYDAVYVALAEALDVELVTTDARLATSHGHQARIISFAG